MIRICICDDDTVFSSNLEEYILEYTSEIEGLEVEIDIYEDGLSLTKSIEKKNNGYQILFLDMEMKQLNGIETARKIRENDKNVYIIYITGYEKYSIDSFEVSPFRYIIKPINRINFQSILMQVIEEIMIRKDYLFFKYQNVQYQIKCESIVAIKSEMGRMIRILLSKSEAEPVLFYGKIKDIEKKLNPLLFIKVNSGTVINLNYVNIITNKEIKMNDGNIYPISRGQKQEVKKKYNIFLERRLGL